MIKLHDLIYSDGEKCRTCPFSRIEREPNGEELRTCESAECDHALLLIEEAKDYLNKATRTIWLTQVLNHYDLWEVAAFMFFHRGEIDHFAEDHLAPAIYKNGFYYPEKERAA